MIFWVEEHAGYNWSLHDHQPKNHEKWKILNDFWVEVQAGDSWSLHDHQPKNHEKWEISNDFWVEVHAGGQLIPSRLPSRKTIKDEKISVIFGLRCTRGTTDPFTITSLKTMKKWKNFKWFLGWGTRGGTADPFTITILKTIKDEKISVIFGLRYTRGTTDPFTITSLKTMKNENFQMILGFEVPAGESWSLHDHHPENHENWKILNDFLGWGTRG